MHLCVSPLKTIIAINDEVKKKNLILNQPNCGFSGDPDAFRVRSVDQSDRWTLILLLFLLRPAGLTVHRFATRWQCSIRSCLRPKYLIPEVHHSACFIKEIMSCIGKTVGLFYLII